ncbi:cytidine deaminase [Glaciecola petra]|uniref:Cytidine deaminase n=1 Tax=Glaciecola petra TaxID=3075602 RepID=A0ABU2ZTJ9_9ALTE|nr:cytidine deaminase [Aestuariibacter sp. P117]MDT0595731.1 cytidine deaminase [Aestuariibacter sp. P117]
MSKQPSPIVLEHLKQELKHAYSPYSGVKVAAAVEFEIDGEKRVAYGVNVENVSYGLTICAERSAISVAISQGMKEITGLYVISNQENPISPCGACRQVVSEFMSAQSGLVYCVNESLEKDWISDLASLLPNRFDL